MLTFAIQIMKTGEAFSTSYNPIMWNENQGPVQVNPYEPGDFTVYSSGQQAMYVMQQISGNGIRLVYLPSGQFPANNNTSRTSERTAILEYQVRDALTASKRGGAKNRFYNKSTGEFQEVAFNSSRGDSNIRYTDAKDIRDLIGSIGGIYELVQQITVV